MTLASEIVPGLAEILEIDTYLRGQGADDEQVDAFMADLRAIDFELVNAQMRAEGLDDEQISMFWLALVPLDDPDSEDT